MTNKQLVQSFVDGTNKRNSRSNIFIDGDTIYSYGYHFPMATRQADGSYIVTNRSYSSSTSRHQRYLEQALRGANKLYAYDPRSPKPQDVTYLEHQASNAYGKATRARKQWNKDYWLEQAHQWEDKAQALSDYLTAKTQIDQDQELLEALA